MQPGTELRMVSVRAAIHLSGLPLGAKATVDANDPYMADLLAAGYLVLEPNTASAADDDEKAVRE